MSMTVKQLNAKIDALGKVNAKVEATIQELGLECLAHCDEHGDTMPMNRLINVLRRTQHQAFCEWVLAFGKFKRNMDGATKDAQPMSYDKARDTDIEGATEKPWFMFGDEKSAAIAKAFDFQQAMRSLIKKAAAAGYDHQKLVQAAAIAGIPAEKVPASVTTVAVVPDALV